MKHVQEEAKSDLARLAEVKKRREEAAARKAMEDKVAAEVKAREDELDDPDAPKRAGPKRGKNKKR